MIESFSGKYRFLSNFYPVPGGILLDGWRYRTVEHAYQAAKTVVVSERRQVQLCKTPGHAKRVGRRVTLRHNWDSMKVWVMYQLLLRKFAANMPLAASLLGTGERRLVEGNTGDRYWGVYEGEGLNLGLLLMQVRASLRDLQE